MEHLVNLNHLQTTAEKSRAYADELNAELANTTIAAIEDVIDDVSNKLDTTGTAASATKLATARTIQTNLASTTAASFNGTADITPGVTGTLPIANGGTGNSTGLAASATKLATARTIDGVPFDGSANVVHYGTCSTAAATAAKVVALTGFTLSTGSKIAVKFTYSNTASSPTLNVNDTGAIAIKSYGTTAISTYAWYTGSVVEFVYDGTNWVMIDGSIATTTYYGRTKLSSSTSSTSTSLAATASAVKAAYDLATTAQTTADSKADKGSAVSFSIPTSGWSSDSTTGYPYYYDIAVSDITANDRAEIDIAPTSITTVMSSGLCPVSETLAGVIRLRASTVPTTAISAQYWIEKGV